METLMVLAALTVLTVAGCSLLFSLDSLASEQRAPVQGRQAAGPGLPAPPEGGAVAAVHRWSGVNYQELIELGYARREALLHSPGVEDVEVSVMGEHLVLTVYRKGPAPKGGEHAEAADALLPVDSYCAMGFDGCG